MKRSAWLLAAGLATIAAALSIGSADDREPVARRTSSGPPASPFPQYFSRGGEKGSAGNRSTVPGNASPSFRLRGVTQSSAAGSFPKNPGEAGPRRQISTRLPGLMEDGRPVFGKQSSHFSPKAGTSLKHADYQRPAGKKDATSVRHAVHRRNKANASAANGVPAYPATRSVSRKLQPPVPPVPQRRPRRSRMVQPVSYSRSPLLSGRKLPAGLQTPTVSVEWKRATEINVGQECECDLVVKNTGTIDAENVVVLATFPESVRVVSAAPQPLEAGREQVVWKFVSLPAGQQQVIRVKLIPGRAGELTTTAAVRFTGRTAGRFVVKEPLLKLALSGPQKVMVGDAATQFIEISNPGTGVARRVAIEAWIPPGLEHPRGERLMMDIGTLNPGETRQVRLSLTATAGGKQTLRVKATSLASLTQTAQRTVLVESPSLKIALKGPGLRYVGRPAVYAITVTNDGTVATNNVRVLYRLPEGFRFLKADKGGSYDPAKRTIAWFVGQVESGSTVSVQAMLEPVRLGDYVHQAGVVSEQGATAQTSFTTKVDGTASLLVEIVNPDDPVEIGTATIYEVRIRNAGTKADTHVVLACELPAGVELLGAKGPTRAVAEKGRILFGPLDSLPPGKTALYRVQVRGTQPGNHRFRARLTSDSVKNPLTYDELTKFYQD